jgi:isopropylmalate/homocitrate/citramalate synthase
MHHKHSLSEEQFKKELQKIKEKEKEKYRSRVREYTSYKIGRKLP